MTKSIKRLMEKFLEQGHERSLKAKKNIVASLLVKVASISISLLVVPLTLNYVDTSQYGIWLTLSSIVAWFSFFDIGVTNGLRNKFAEAIAKNDHNAAQIYISTTYTILGLIFLAVWMGFMLINPFLDWADMLNLSNTYNAEVSTLALIVFTYFCLQFVLRIITTIVAADQQPAQAALVDLIGQFISLVIIFMLVKTTEGSLVNLGLALCLSPLLALIAANIFFFKGKYHRYRPLLSKVKFSSAKSLFNLGLIFFVIQIAGLVQYESANIIISRNYGPSEVTSYNIAYKYFNILNMGFMIFLTPFWSASTEAFIKKDFDWIKNSVRIYNLLTVLFICVGVIMLLFSESIYNLWLGKDKVDIDFWLSFWALMFFICSLFGSKYVSFLNGISALRIQFWACLLSPVLYILIVMILIKYFDVGVYAVFIAAIFANFNGYILAPLQYYFIIYKKKQGIWIR